mmetsp:Transcript_30623/g.88776  ORF Transcript_30623/g.88776 Transcript_30623/m.88776 type:complete len:349 (-) Transcript_30623:860-1906(-)
MGILRGGTPRALTHPASPAILVRRWGDRRVHHNGSPKGRQHQGGRALQPPGGGGGRGVHVFVDGGRDGVCHRGCGGRRPHHRVRKGRAHRTPWQHPDDGLHHADRGPVLLHGVYRHFHERQAVQRIFQLGLILRAGLFLPRHPGGVDGADFRLFGRRVAEAVRAADVHPAVYAYVLGDVEEQGILLRRAVHVFDLGHRRHQHDRGRAGEDEVGWCGGLRRQGLHFVWEFLICFRLVLGEDAVPRRQLAHDVDCDDGLPPSGGQHLHHDHHLRRLPQPLLLLGGGRAHRDPHGRQLRHRNLRHRRDGGRRQRRLGLWAAHDGRQPWRSDLPSHRQPGLRLVHAVAVRRR